MNDGAAGMTGTIKHVLAPLSLPLAAAGRCPEALRRAMTSKNVNPPNATPPRPACL
jgi:hypothetical protein